MNSRGFPILPGTSLIENVVSEANSVHVRVLYSLRKRGIFRITVFIALLESLHTLSVFVPRLRTMYATSFQKAKKDPVFILCHPQPCLTSKPFPPLMCPVIMYSDQLITPRGEKTERNNSANDPQDAIEPRVPLVTPIAPGHRYIHTEKTANQVQGHEDGSDERDFAEDLIGMVTLRDLIDGDLGEVIGVGAAEHFLEMAEVAHHRDDVVLDVAEVEADFTAGRDGVLLVAALGEALDHVCFAAEEAHEAHDALAALAYLTEERGVVVGAGDEDLVFD